MSKIASTVHQVRHPADPDRHSRPTDSSPDSTRRHRRDDQRRDDQRRDDHRRSPESYSHRSRHFRRSSSSPRHSRATSHQRSDRGQSPEIVLSTRRHDSDGRRSSPDRRRGRHRSRSPLRQQKSSSSKAAHHASSSRRASSSARDPSPPATASQTSGRDRASRRPDSESTLTASSPHQQRRTPPEQPPPRVTVTPRRRPQPPRDEPRTPGVIYVPQILELPRTPGHFSSPDNSPGLDLTRAPRRQLPPPSPGDSDRPWDQFSAVSEGPTASEHQEQPETPLTWTHVVDLIYRSGMVDPSTVPTSPEPVRSVIGGPLPVEKRRVALPPSPLTTACLSSAMKSCWGGP